jgi:hypothetical protein
VPFGGENASRDLTGTYEARVAMKMTRRIVTAALLAGSAVLSSARADAADPTTADCLTASDSAVTLSSQHKLRAARAQWLICASASCPADIRKECFRHVEEVNAAIPTIIFEPKNAAGRDVGAVKVTMDGEVIAERLQGVALSIDPGNHTFVFETAGQPAVQEQLLIQEGDKDRRERVVFGLPGAVGTTAPTGPVGTPAATTGPAGAPATTGSAAPSLSSTPDVPSPSSPSGLGTQKILAIVAGGVGVVGVGIGAIFGLQALSKKNDAQNVCPNVCSDQQGADRWSDAKSTATVSTIAFIAGAVALGGAAALWFTAKPESASAPSTQLGLGLGTIQLKGTW